MPIGNSTSDIVAAANHRLKLPIIVPDFLDKDPKEEVLVPNVSVNDPVNQSDQ